MEVRQMNILSLKTITRDLTYKNGNMLFNKYSPSKKELLLYSQEKREEWYMIVEVDRVNKIFKRIYIVTNPKLIKGVNLQYKLFKIIEFNEEKPLEYFQSKEISLRNKILIKKSLKEAFQI